MYNDNMNYSDILERLKVFDLDAFDELYVHARERLFVYAFSILSSEEAAQDVVQELFVDFWESQLFLRIHTDLAGYLTRMTRNRSLNYVKKAQNQARLQYEYFCLETGLIEPDMVAARELGREIEAAINRLPPMPARVFRLHYLERLSYAEIANALQISPNTVSNHMSKALKELRNNLKKMNS